MTGMRHFAGERWQLTDGLGQRKYLTLGEREEFLEAAARASGRGTGPPRGGASAP